ncbi:hypothetical protein [Nostoc sp.]
MEQVGVQCCQCDRCPCYQRSDRLFYSEGDDIVVRFITNQNTSV